MKTTMKPALDMIIGLFALACASCTPMSAAPAPVSAGGTLYDAARKEGRVVVYSVLSTRAAQPLISDFQSLYPGIKVDYDGDKGSTEMDARYRNETAADGTSADVVWSSATDMQMQLVQQGYAADYRSPEAAHLPAWAIYRNKAYGTTLEPVVFVYNKNLLAATDVPKSHQDFLLKLRAHPDRYRGKVTGFDIGKSGVGFMFTAQDEIYFAANKDLLDAFGSVGFSAGSGTGDMLTGIQSGKYLIGYNIMGAYALSRSEKDLPDLKIVFPSDYTLLLSRVAFVSKQALHPNAGRLWLDYLLSARGQEVLGNHIDLFPVRKDIESKRSASDLLQRLGKGATPIPLNARTAASLEPGRHTALVADWTQRTGSTSTETRN